MAERARVLLYLLFSILESVNNIVWMHAPCKLCFLKGSDYFAKPKVQNARSDHWSLDRDGLAAKQQSERGIDLYRNSINSLRLS